MLCIDLEENRRTAELTEYTNHITTLSPSKHFSQIEIPMASSHSCNISFLMFLLYLFDFMDAFVLLTKSFFSVIVWAYVYNSLRESDERTGAIS